MGINFDLDAIESYVAGHLRLFIIFAVGLLAFVGIVAVSVFFIAVRGADQTMVPDVTGKELSAALLELQVKELYPRIQLRYSQTSRDKGLILEQEPRPGTIVKAGRRIRLVVSQGVMINKVENYLGRNIDEVRLDLQALFAAEGSVVPLVTLKEPLMYMYSAEAPGTVIQQQPEPDFDISGPMVLELVVSRGPEDSLIEVPALVSLPLEEALEEIGRSGISFVFNVAAESEAAPLTVTAQLPEANSMVRPDTEVSITISPPALLPPGEVFNVFRYSMSRNPYPLPMRLEAELPSGEQRRIISAEYSGGDLALPYKLPVGTVLVLYVLNREVYRETAAPPLDGELTLEQF